MERVDTEVVLILGATSDLGKLIVNSLLRKSKKVRIIVNSYKELNDAFSESEINSFEYFIHDFNENKNKDDLIYSFSSTANYVISVLNDNETFNINEKALNTKQLIDAAVKNSKIIRFCLITSSYVNRPYSYVAYKLNTRSYALNVMADIEHYLRNSRLNYLIIRPTEMVSTGRANDFSMTQGGNVEGTISINTVGCLVADSLLDSWVGPYSSYECFSTQEQQKLNYCYSEGTHRYRTETESERIHKPHHIRARRIIQISVISFVVVSSILMYTITKKLITKNKSKFLEFWNKLFYRKNSTLMIDKN